MDSEIDQWVAPRGFRVSAAVNWVAQSFGELTAINWLELIFGRVLDARGRCRWS